MMDALFDSPFKTPDVDALLGAAQSRMAPPSGGQLVYRYPGVQTGRMGQMGQMGASPWIGDFAGVLERLRQLQPPQAAPFAPPDYGAGPTASPAGSAGGMGQMTDDPSVASNPASQASMPATVGNISAAMMGMMSAMSPIGMGINAVNQQTGNRGLVQMGIETALTALGLDAVGSSIGGLDMSGLTAEQAMDVASGLGLGIDSSPSDADAAAAASAAANEASGVGVGVW